MTYFSTIFSTASNSNHHINCFDLLCALHTRTSELRLTNTRMLIPTEAVTAIPIVRTLAQCADYKIVVEPFTPQLYELPKQIFQHIRDPAALRQIYLSTNPVISGLALSLALFPIFLVVSEVNRNWSQVDRFWSILPSVYHVHYAIWTRLNGLSTEKIDNVLLFSLIWTTRLTYNYWRRGGYQIGSEDYRWELVKGYIGTPAFFLLNVFFTSSLQSVCVGPICCLNNPAD